MVAAPLDLKRAATFPSQGYKNPRNQTTALKYNRFPNLQIATRPACRSTGRSTDPFHRSTGQSTGCPTESWVFTVSRLGRPPGRPSFWYCGRSTGPVDRPTCFLLLLLSSAAFSSSTSLAITSTTPRQSMLTSSAIFSLSNKIQLASFTCSYV